VARTPKVPSYRLHKPSGMAVVTLGGRDKYLGKHDSKESHVAYKRAVAEFYAGQETPRGDAKAGGAGKSIDVARLALLYLEWAIGNYRKNNKPTTEINWIKSSLKPLIEIYGDTPVSDFGPLKLKAIQKDLIRSDYCRNVVNSKVQRIVRIFRWAMGEELVSAEVYTALTGVQSLRKGQLGVRETEPVKPVADEVVNAIKLFVPDQVWAMIDLQRLTGMRPGEVVIMKGGDIDRSGTTWIYTPESHKTEHRGKSRIIFLGPKAREIVTPFLRDDPSEYLFSPKNRMEEKRSVAKAKAKPRKRKSKRKANPRRAPGARYTRESYYNVINSACIKAGSKHFHPNQLRHSAATALRREFGIEVARAVLGHSSSSQTEIYAERDGRIASGAMERIG
jgi:integrase